ncbi:nonsense-mediated mRNA decay factor SMG7-like [Andrographis paniculata]|uniref:nonsense-mediated mRNA decay factor SMG7-like n=1 Tax=Andrographis paniculata TaxID=175694 RepID=UPI0021E728B0|nr:nonsense-mediated mRNA decay factor SMG7-like [Andrographis paniculata]
MTVLMNNGRESSSKERVRSLFDKNAELETKRREAAVARVPSDPNTWQTLRDNYEAILLEDHTFSEQHDIEYALWQLHYKRIEQLRRLHSAAQASSDSAASQNGNGNGPIRGGPDRLGRINSQFKTFLSEASGFYHDLMLKIGAKYGLPLGYFTDDPKNQIPMSKDGSKSSDVQKGLMSCHRCLIYLGDLSRYKGMYVKGDSKARDFDAASSYYTQASSLCPASGNPHHQLAILAGYSNDELLSIYRYFRSLAVENPFSTARDNLIIAFEKNRQSYTLILGDAKKNKAKTITSRVPRKGRGKEDAKSPLKENKVKAIAVKEETPSKIELFGFFVTRFLRLNGILFTRTSLETFAEVLSVVKIDLMKLLSSGLNEELNFGLDAAQFTLAIVRMVAILIFTVYNVSRENGSQSYADTLQRAVLLENAFTAAFEFMGCVLERCDQLYEPSSSYLLPGIMVFVEWLACCQDAAVGSEMEEKQVNARCFFWNKCVSFLNKILSSGCMSNEDEDDAIFSNMTRYDQDETNNRLALPEDFELRGFLPLAPAQLILDFSKKHFVGYGVENKENTARVQRIIAAGKSLANNVRVGCDGVYFDSKVKKFLFGIEPQKFEEPLLSIGGRLDIPVGVHTDLNTESKKVVAENAEDEDEDEVIVFKPSLYEKQMDDFSRNIYFGNENQVSAVAQESFIIPPASSSVNPAVTVANEAVNSPSKYLHPGQQDVGILNGLTHLNLVENTFPKKEMQDNFGAPQVSGPSTLHSQIVDNRNYSNQVPPSKFESIKSSVAFADGIPVNLSTISPGLKKNPVCRPTRNIGPPPGFGSVPSKTVDETLPNSVKKNEIHPIPEMEDYSWLTGSKTTSLNPNFGFSTLQSHVSSTLPSLCNSGFSMGISDFPFPGKQVSALNVQNGNQKIPQDYKLLEQVKQDREQPLFQEVNQQPIKPPQQYPGQPSWNSRFLV